MEKPLKDLTLFVSERNYSFMFVSILVRMQIYDFSKNF